MLELIIAILALALGAVALFFSMRKKSFIDMAEFKGLNSGFAGMYRDNIVHGLAPLMVQRANDEWTSLTPSQQTELIQRAAGGEKLLAAMYAKQNNAPGLAAMMKSMPH